VEADAVVKLTLLAKGHRDIGDRVLDAFRNVLSTITSAVEEVGVAELTLKLREGLAADWRAKADEVLDRLAQAGKPVVVCLDELPVLVSALLLGEELALTPDRTHRARVFLSWLRDATIRHRGTIRFIASGSIGLEPLLSRAGISETMTTFRPLAVGPWSPQTARLYIQDRARRNSIEVEAEAAQAIVSHLGELIPHHVALFMYFLRSDAARRGADRCSHDDVNRVYTEHMLSVHGHVDLATYEDRLKRVVDPTLLRPSLELLTEAAVVGRLVPKAAQNLMVAHGLEGPDATQALRFLLGVFEHDGYLKRSAEGYVFASHLVRDWWRNRFGFGYVAALER
jgi:hypothetical protein